MKATLRLVLRFSTGDDSGPVPTGSTWYASSAIRTEDA